MSIIFFGGNIGIGVLLVPLPCLNGNTSIWVARLSNGFRADWLGQFAWNSLLDGKMKVGLSENACISCISPFFDIKQWTNQLQLKVSRSFSEKPLTLWPMAVSGPAPTETGGFATNSTTETIDRSTAVMRLSAATWLLPLEMERHGVWLMIGFGSLAASTFWGYIFLSGYFKTI